jgi:hypothetical protein
MIQRILFFGFLVFLTNFPNEGYSQSDSHSAVYLELFGNGLTYSLNYDMRFSGKPDGIGGRAGIGYFAIDGISLATVPLMVNYLMGKNGKYFEIGAGATYLAAADRQNSNPTGSPINRGTGWIGSLSFGYRSQPVDGGFLFRAGVTPFFDRSSFWPFWPQVSVGYAF